MTNNEILKKAIEKAQRNGFYFDNLPDKLPDIDHEFNWLDTDRNIKTLSDKDINCKNLICIQVDNLVATWIGLYDVIFSHDFAKAFWGEIPINEEDEEGRIISYFTFTNVSDDIRYDWQGHLQQMVLEKEPLKYLEKFL